MPTYTRTTIDPPTCKEAINANSHMFTAGNTFTAQQLCEILHVDYSSVLAEPFKAYSTMLSLMARCNKYLVDAGLYLSSSNYASEFTVLGHEPANKRASKMTRSSKNINTTGKKLRANARAFGSNWDNYTGGRQRTARASNFDI